MSLPSEQALAMTRAVQFLSDLLSPRKTPRVPRAVRQEASRRLKHFPRSYDLERMVADKFAMQQMEEAEAHYRKQFWGETKDGR
jgi:hypothetical protein